MFIADREYETVGEGIARCVFVEKDGSGVFIYGSGLQRLAAVVFPTNAPNIIGAPDPRYCDDSFAIVRMIHPTHKHTFYIDAKSADEINPYYMSYNHELVYDRPIEGSEKVFEVEVTTRVIREITEFEPHHNS